MHLLYIDDSGDDGRSAGSSTHFLLGCLAVKVSAWRTLVKQVDGLVVKHLGAAGANVELHGSDMMSGRNFYRSVPALTREALFRDVLQEIGNPQTPVTLFFVVIHKNSLPVTRGVRVVATLQLCQRLNAYLTSIGQDESGILICDEHTQQSQIKSLMAVIHSTGMPRQLRDNLIETAFFAKSHESRLLQVADLACHAVQRFVAQADDRFFPLIEGKIHRATAKRRNPKTKKLTTHTIHYGFRYIAKTPADGLPRVLPFKLLRVAALTNLPAGSFLKVEDLETELIKHGM